jgi:hypothetical protein
MQKVLGDPVAHDSSDTLSREIPKSESLGLTVTDAAASNAAARASSTV